MTKKEENQSRTTVIAADSTTRAEEENSSTVVEEEEDNESSTEGISDTVLFIENIPTRGDEKSIEGIAEAVLEETRPQDEGERRRNLTLDIESLLEAGVGLEKLEELYGKEEVHTIVQARIIRQLESSNLSMATATINDNNSNKEDPIKKEENANHLARLLFLRSGTLQVLENNTVMDAVIHSLVADPDDPLLLDPLMMTPLKDPVLISSGYILDRATAVDDDGKLRMDACPFSRQPLTLPIYPCIPIRNRLKVWENQRMERCIEVATKLVELEEWHRASRVLEIAEVMLQEMGETTNIHFAKALADLERSLIPYIVDEKNLLRIVKIYTRLIRAANTGHTNDKKMTLLRSALKDCHQKMNIILFRFDHHDESNNNGGGIILIQECHKARQLFTNEVLTRRVLKDYQRSLSNELLDLYYSDLILAKSLFFFEPKYLLDVWNCRRSILELLRMREQQHNEEKATEVKEDDETAVFLRRERLLGTEKELTTTSSFGSATANESDDYTKYWPKEKMLEGEFHIGLVHFDKLYHSRKMKCLVDLNPQHGCNNWIEVAFRPLQDLPGKPYSYPIFSQCGAATGWEIRVGTVPQSSNTNRSSSIHVEAVWTTSVNNQYNHNAFTNKHISIKMGTWYHVVLAYHRATSTVTLYVNGKPSRIKLEDNAQFKKYHKCNAMLGQSSFWKDRQLKCMIAFASGKKQFPITEEGTSTNIADYYVTKLSKCRLESLQECSAANATITRNLLPP